MAQLRQVFLLLFLLFPMHFLAAEKSEAAFVRNIAATILTDYSSFYSIKNLPYLFGGLGVSGILANTNADLRIQDWFQESVRNKRTDQFSKVVKPIGGKYEPVGIYAGAAILGYLARHTTSGTTAHEWGSKSLRAIIVGAPLVGVLQYGLGSSRPTERGSEWRPFQDTNGVSGHAFMGAIPFLTAAGMVESVYLKTVFYMASAATGLSRINDNKHYLSQALAGWWIACLAVKGLDIAKKPKAALNPTFLPDGWAMQLCFPL